MLHDCLYSCFIVMKVVQLAACMVAGPQSRTRCTRNGVIAVEHISMRGNVKTVPSRCNAPFLQV